MAHTPPGQTRERVFSFVRQRLLQGLPPTIREVQQAMGMRAVESARAQLCALVADGRLVRQPGRARGFALPRVTGGAEGAAGAEAGPPPILVPLLGRVQAGALSEALEDPEGFVPLQSRHPPERLFALRVQGRSMIGAGILPGDVVIVLQQPTARDGETVVALVEGEATVKTLRIRRGRPELQPANPRYRTIRPDPEQLRLLGKVIEVRRTLE